MWVCQKELAHPHFFYSFFFRTFLRSIGAQAQAEDLRRATSVLGNQKKNDFPFVFRSLIRTFAA